jgi:hypothetical protein
MGCVGVQNRTSADGEAYATKWRRIAIRNSGGAGDERAAERTIANITMDEALEYIVGAEAESLSAIAPAV